MRLPSGELAKLADLQRKGALKKKLADPPRPLFQGLRELMLRKCAPDSQEQVRAIFEKEAFGELERLVTQKLLDVAKRVAKEELESENWLRLVARLSGRSYQQMRVTILEFLETDVFHVSIENWVSFLDPLIESWDVDLRTFGVEVVLNRRLALAPVKRFEFVEKEPEHDFEVEPGLEEFLQDTFPQRRRLRGGNRVSEEAEVRRKAACSPVLLPRAAKPQGPPAFSSLSPTLRGGPRCRRGGRAGAAA